ncbi:MAG TPA: hypothetical protein VG847_06080 [Chitinophagaceae bacterium]|nr:hypothetical protein [Chitinophagaceae bacterium]
MEDKNPRKMLNILDVGKLLMQCGALHDLAEIAEDKNRAEIAKQIKRIEENIEDIITIEEDA